MSKKIAKPNGPKPVVLPKDALSRVNLGQAFAEYDPVLIKPGVFVRTPALVAALDSNRAKCFFVGRRGTGKTALTYYLGAQKGNVLNVHPQLFATLSSVLNEAELRDVRQQPFHSLVACFRRAMLDEVLAEWIRRHLTEYNRFPEKLRSERNYIEDFDFDTRILAFVEESEAAHKRKDDKAWIRLRNRAKEVSLLMDGMREGPKWEFILLIDRIDDTWNGSDLAVVLLMALMHACVELAAHSQVVHPVLFLRENLFQRVRQIDTEFSRLETAVVSLDWTQELLVEMIERRLQTAVNTKPPIGQTWDCFFELIDGKSSHDYVLNYCQNRRRDVLIYCNNAIEEAQSHKHTKVTFDDLRAARRKFSLSRLKDVGDEYSENFPRIQLVLERFHGLGNVFTLYALTQFIEKLLVDSTIQKHCHVWINEYTAPHRFATLLYSIGFVGIKNKGIVEYRSHEASSESPPIDVQSEVVIHPCYADALDLREAVVSSLTDTPLQSEGLVLELPESFSLDTYTGRLDELLTEIDSIKCGREDSGRYEEFVGEVIRLCFFKSLNNIQALSRDIKGCTIRDWIRATASSVTVSIVSCRLAEVKASSEQFSVELTESLVSRRCWHGGAFGFDGVAL